VVVAPPGAVSRLPEGGRFIALDSLRGVAATIVAAFHFGPAGIVLGLPFFRNGWLFVDFFFVLSGFVIAGAYGARLQQGFSVRSFMTLRLGRIYPLHLIVLLAWIAAAFTLAIVSGRPLMTVGPFATPHSIRSLALTAALSQWFVYPTPMAWSAQSWSIAVEVWLYFGVALIWRWLGRRSWIVLACMATATLAIVPYEDALAGPGPLNPGMLRGIGGFSLGVVGWWLWERKLAGPAVRLPFIAATLAEATLVALTLFALGWRELPALPVWTAPLFLLWVLTFAAERGLVSRVLKLPPMVWLGVLSYSIYMTHPLVIGIGRRPWDALSRQATARADLIGLALIAATIALSYFSWRFIEWPAREWSRRRARAMHTIREESVAPTI
jgi:peptidoglycan/LPS O-acetylase OafA/YrhL